jgi:hypothetical protein
MSAGPSPQYNPAIHWSYETQSLIEHMIKAVMAIDFLLAKSGESWGTSWSDYTLCPGLTGVPTRNGTADAMACSLIPIALLDDDGTFFNFHLRRAVMPEADLTFPVKTYDFVHPFVLARNDILGSNMERRRLDLLNSLSKV